MSEAPDIDLEAFVEQMLGEVQAFARQWRNSSAEDPANWPRTMPLGEWDEQFHAFTGSLD
jgi:hypothetical protein